MFEVLLLILVLTIIISYTLLLAKFLHYLYKHDTKITRLMLIAMFGVTFGVLVDCFRLFLFLTFDFIDITSDRLFFVIKFFLLFVGVAAMFRVVVVLNRQSGHKVPHESLIRYSILALLGTVSFLNILLSFEAKEIYGIGEGGFYTLQIHQGLFIAIIVISIPMVVFLILRLKLVFKELRDKSLANKFILLGVLFIILIAERYYNLGQGHLFLPSSLEMLIIEFSLLAIVSVSATILLLKNPDLLERLSTYFCVQSIYVLKKKGGHLLYGLDLHKEDQTDGINPENLLLGGFIYAISRGLEITLKLSGDLELIEMEGNNLLFKQGRYVVGLIFTTELLPTTQFNLLLFLQKFEKHFESILRNWTGDLTEFQTEPVKEWIYDIFRPGYLKK